jgi:lysyl-tRNA synthetase class II
MNRVQIAQFEQEKIYSNVNMNTISDEEKSKQFAKSYKILNDINFTMLSDSVIEIETPQGQKATDRQEIKNFLNNCDAVLVKEIEDKVAEIRRSAQMKAVQLKATDEQVLKGVPATYKIPLTFDNSNFFG